MKAHKEALNRQGGTIGDCNTYMPRGGPQKGDEVTRRVGVRWDSEIGDGLPPHAYSTPKLGGLG